MVALNVITITIASWNILRKKTRPICMWCKYIFRQYTVWTNV